MIVRLKIVALRKESVPYSQIASQLNVSESAAKKLWRRYQTAGEVGLQTRYENCGRNPIYSAAVREVVLSHQESEQGGPYIRSVLRVRHPHTQIPHERTIQRWWKANGGGRSGPRNNRAKPASWAKEAHSVWQIDGKEQIELGQGQQVSWVNIVDEASRSPLQTEASPLCHDESVSDEGFCSDLQSGLQALGTPSEDQN